MAAVRKALLLALGRAFENDGDTGADAAKHADETCSAIMRIVSGILLLCDLDFDEQLSKTGMTAHIVRQFQMILQLHMPRLLLLAIIHYKQILSIMHSTFYSSLWYVLLVYICILLSGNASCRTSKAYRCPWNSFNG